MQNVLEIELIVLAERYYLIFVCFAVLFGEYQFRMWNFWFTSLDPAKNTGMITLGYFSEVWAVLYFSSLRQESKQVKLHCEGGKSIEKL